MMTTTRPITPGSRVWRQLYRAGGLGLSVAGALYLFLVPMLFVIGTVSHGHATDLPQDALGLLDSVIYHAVLPRANATLFILIDVGTLVGYPVLAVALRRVNAFWPIIAVVLVTFGLLYDMQAGLIEWAMSVSFAHVKPTRVDRSLADFLYAYIYRVESPFLAIMLGCAALAMSWAMRHSAFGRFRTWVGYAAGVIAIVGGITGFFPLLLSLGIWYLLVGTKLFIIQDAGLPSQRIAHGSGSEGRTA